MLNVLERINEAKREHSSHVYIIQDRNGNAIQTVDDVGELTKLKIQKFMKGTDNTYIRITRHELNSGKYIQKEL